MGLFDGVLGGVVGAGMVSIVGDILEKHGGIQGVVSELDRKGLGETVRSWVSTGPNQPISPEQLHDALGAQTLHQIATRAGISVPDLAQKLAQVLPQAIDKLTPNGVIPKA